MQKFTHRITSDKFYSLPDRHRHWAVASLQAKYKLWLFCTMQVLVFRPIWSWCSSWCQWTGCMWV